MLRIHFTGEDLARTRVATGPEPLWELVLSMHILRMRNQDPALSTWKRDVSAALRPGSPARTEIDMLVKLNPPLGYFPDFLTPTVAERDFEAAIEAVVETPREVLEREISQLESSSPVLADLRTGSASARKALGRAMLSYQRTALAPVWEDVRAAIDADRALRGRMMVERGVEAMLGAIHPAMRWVDGVLEIEGYRDETDLELGGRGLVLVPSYFKSNEMPMKLADPELPPVLVYAVRKAPAPTPAARRDALAALVGKTRAAVLEVVAEGCTTTELARRLRISMSAASEHAAVLRDSGLLVSTRDANRVVHSLTPLGIALLG